MSRIENLVGCRNLLAGAFAHIGGRGVIDDLRRRPEIDESGRVVMSGGDSRRAQRCILWAHDR